MGLEDLLGLIGDVGGPASDVLADSAAFAPGLLDLAGAGFGAAGDVAGGVGAGIDSANPAFLPDTTGVLNSGANASATGTGQASQFGELGPTGGRLPPTTYGPGNTPLPGEQAAYPYAQPNPNAMDPLQSQGAGQSGTLGDNSYEQSIPGSQPVPPSAGSMPVSHAQTFREAVGALPGKWYNAFANAPGQAVDYAGEHPFKTGAMLAGLGSTLYSASQPAPQAPAWNFPAPTSGAAKTPPLPSPGPSESPILAGRPQPSPRVGGRGGMRVGL